MKKIMKLLMMIIFLFGALSFGDNFGEETEIESSLFEEDFDEELDTESALIKEVYGLLMSETDKFNDESDYDKSDYDEAYARFLEKAIIFLESEVEKSETGEAESLLGMIYSGGGFSGEDNIKEIAPYQKLLDSLNLTFEDRMKLSEKYLLTAISKGNIEISSVYLCYIYALQGKYGLSEKYYEKFRDYYKKNNPNIDWLDARSEGMSRNQIKAGLIYRIVLDDGEEEYYLQIMEEFPIFYPPNYDVIIKYYFKGLELGHINLKINLAKLYYKKGDLELSERYYREVIEDMNNKLYDVEDYTKLFYIRKLEELLKEQGRELDKKYIIISKELNKKISK